MLDHVQSEKNKYPLNIEHRMINLPVDRNQNENVNIRAGSEKCARAFDNTTDVAKKPAEIHLKTICFYFVKNKKTHRQESVEINEIGTSTSMATTSAMINAKMKIFDDDCKRVLSRQNMKIIFPLNKTPTIQRKTK